jgi:hypothetical protein
LLLATAGALMLVILYRYWQRSAAFLYIPLEYNSRMESHPLSGLWLSLSAAGGLLAMAAWELRRALAAHENSPPSKLDGLRSQDSQVA